MTLLAKTIILFNAVLMQERQMARIVGSAANDHRRKTKYMQWLERLREPVGRVS
jgi:hypothetical protein